MKRVMQLRTNEHSFLCLLKEYREVKKSCIGVSVEARTLSATYTHLLAKNKVLSYSLTLKRQRVLFIPNISRISVTCPYIKTSKLAYSPNLTAFPRSKLTANHSNILIKSMEFDVLHVSVLIPGTGWQDTRIYVYPQPTYAPSTHIWTGRTSGTANYLRCFLTFLGIDIISFGSGTDPVISYIFYSVQ